MSKLEDKLAHQLKMAQLDPEWWREHRFHPERKWRFDFAWPNQMLAVEIQGGIYMKKGGHTSVTGFQRDCDKFNAGVILGWRILKFTPKDVQNGTALQTIEKALSHD